MRSVLTITLAATKSTYENMLILSSQKNYELGVKSEICEEEKSEIIHVVRTQYKP